MNAVRAFGAVVGQRKTVKSSFPESIQSVSSVLGLGRRVIVRPRTRSAAGSATNQHNVVRGIDVVGGISNVPVRAE